MSNLDFIRGRSSIAVRVLDRRQAAVRSDRDRLEGGPVRGDDVRGPVDMPPRADAHRHEREGSEHRRDRAPRIDVLERDTYFVLHAELPGIHAEDLDVSVTASTVTIEAANGVGDVDPQGEYHRKELPKGGFRRSIALPAEIDVDTASATLHRGMMEFVLPKLQPAAELGTEDVQVTASEV